jgi:hypothetical protein
MRPVTVRAGCAQVTCPSMTCITAPASATPAPTERIFVDRFETEKCRWVIAPLVDAGLGPDRIRDLIFRVSFDAIVDGGYGDPQRLTELVRDEPEEIRTAWAATITRLFLLREPVS